MVSRKCLLTSKQVIVVIRVNSVGFGSCAAGLLLTEQVWRLFTDTVRLRNSSTHSHRVTLQTGSVQILYVKVKVLIPHSENTLLKVKVLH